MTITTTTPMPRPPAHMDTSTRIEVLGAQYHVSVNGVPCFFVATDGAIRTAVAGQRWSLWIAEYAVALAKWVAVQGPRYAALQSAETAEQNAAKALEKAELDAAVARQKLAAAKHETERLRQKMHEAGEA